MTVETEIEPKTEPKPEIEQRIRVYCPRDGWIVYSNPATKLTTCIRCKKQFDAKKARKVGDKKVVKIEDWITHAT